MLTYLTPLDIHHSKLPANSHHLQQWTRELLRTRKLHIDDDSQDVPEDPDVEAAMMLHLHSDLPVSHLLLRYMTGRLSQMESANEVGVAVAVAVVGVVAGLGEEVVVKRHRIAPLSMAGRLEALSRERIRPPRKLPRGTCRQQRRFLCQASCMSKMYP